MKVLIAEDNLINQQLMNHFVKRIGWECKVVDNGKAAVEACMNDSYDAILMDVDMLVLDGIAATRSIREFNQQIPVVAVTAYVDDVIRDKCALAGMNAFLPKPCTREELMNVVAECVNATRIRVA
jgi:CheY-like chemotaxis protein